MGNLLSNSNNVNSEKKVVEKNYGKLDNLSKSKMIEYIQQLKIKSLEVDDTTIELIKQVDFESSLLIPMSVELYEKLHDTLPKHVPDKKSYKHMYFVKPRFGVEKVYETVTTKRDKSCVPIDCGEINDPKHKFNVAPISVVEFIDAFNNATFKRDMMGVSKKLLKSMSDYQKQRFVSGFNKILDGKNSINYIAFGKGSYIYKANKGGPKDDINSFRQIVSIPNIVSHFHRILNIRLSNFLLKNKYINTDIQKGGVIGQSNALLQQIFKVKSVIKDANTKKKGLAIAFLDISNAFGNLKLNGLFQVMKKYHVPKKYIDYIRDYYANLEYYVQTSDWKTKSMEWEDGLIQGCPLSPTLFIMTIGYILDYLEEQHKESCGYEIGELKLLLLAFIDDVCIIAKDVESLGKIFDKVEALFNLLGLPLSKEKCAIMLVNQDRDQIKGTSLENLSIVKTYKYLGEYISSDGTNSDSYSNFIKTIGRRLYGLDNRKVTDEEKLAIFNKVLLPSMIRRLALMYDLNKRQKNNIVALVKKYLDKWGNDDEVCLFSLLSNLLKDADDQFIKNSDLDIKDEDGEDIEIKDFVIKDTLDVKYTNINDDEQILNGLEEIEAE